MTSFGPIIINKQSYTKRFCGDDRNNQRIIKALPYIAATSKKTPPGDFLCGFCRVMLIVRSNNNVRKVNRKEKHTAKEFIIIPGG